MTKNDSIIVELTVHTCAKCPHASNNAQENDDPFISSPTTIYWYCNQGKNTRKTVSLDKPYLEIAKNCPLR